jgi:putative acetyltransferase
MASPLRALLAYLEAFEVAYDSDDWSVLDPHFSEDASYSVEGAAPFTGTWKTRAGIQTQFQKICNEFDRRFDERIVSETGRPRLRGDEILFGWQATYTLKGAPDFLLVGDSSARIADGRITELTDIIAPENCLAGEAYLRTYDQKLKPVGAYVPIVRATEHAAGMNDVLDALWTEIQTRYGFQAPNPMNFKPFAAPRSALWIAYSAGKPAGSIGLYPFTDNEAELDAMYVAPAWRGTGLGQRLMAVAGRFAQHNRFQSIKLRAGEPQPEAMRFYEKAGFRRIESFGKWKSDPTAVCFEKSLR